MMFDLPDTTVRQTEAIAVARGVPFQRFLAEAIEESLYQCTAAECAGRNDFPWMDGFGVLADLSEETSRILEVIEQEFDDQPSSESCR